VCLWENTASGGGSIRGKTVEYSCSISGLAVEKYYVCFADGNDEVYGNVGFLTGVEVDVAREELYTEIGNDRISLLISFSFQEKLVEDRSRIIEGSPDYLQLTNKIERDRYVHALLDDDPREKTLIQIELPSYIKKLTPTQREALATCVDIVNSVRTAAGCEGRNIENKYADATVETEETRDSTEQSPMSKRKRTVKPTAESIIANAANTEELVKQIVKAEAKRMRTKILRLYATQKDIADITAKEYGDWEPQDDYITTADIKIGSLRTLRETQYAILSKTEPEIGVDKSGNIFKKIGKRDNDTYQYFVFDDQ